MEIKVKLPVKYEKYVKKIVKLNVKRGGYEYKLILNPGYAINGEYDAILLSTKREIPEVLKMVEKRRSYLSRLKQKLIERYVIM